MLNRDSEKLLRRIAKEDVQSMQFMQEHRSEYDELLGLGYIKHEHLDSFGLITYQSKLVITSKGRSYQKDAVASKIKFYVSTLLSLIAVFISIIALLKP